jgi:glycerol-3-phosphate dehydrogenase
MANGNQSGDDSFDVLIIGGGATGLGCAVDAASRGYRTALVEGGEFGSGTSSRSTKLFHGGVRYLPQMRFGLVREALAERAILHHIAPSLVAPLGIILPVSGTFELAYYAAGLKLYDVLAGSHNLESSRMLSQRDIFERLPALRRDGVKGGIRYVDAQFDDEGYIRALAATARQQGAQLFEQMRASNVVIVNERVSGVITSSKIFSARAVVNATGVRSDSIRRLSNPDATPMIAASRGSHIVLPGDVLGSRDGLLIPKTDDGRVIFALPWKGNALVGTTDIPVERVDEEPRASEEEIDYLLEHARRYFTRPISRSDVLATYAGLRPLIRAGGASTAALSREHLVEVDRHGLVSVLGGKWTTYRRMAKEAIDAAARTAGLPGAASRTQDLKLVIPT